MKFMEYFTSLAHVAFKNEILLGTYIFKRNEI